MVVNQVSLFAVIVGDITTATAAVGSTMAGSATSSGSDRLRKAN